MVSRYLGDDRLRHHIVFERNTYMQCVYCGEAAKTREHTPSKVFLQKPYPNDLLVVPSCVECNNMFSSDELYVALLLELLKNHYISDYTLTETTLKRLEKKEGKQAKNTFEVHLSHHHFLFNDFRIKRILHKLAVCHATYEISEGYYGSAWESNAQEIEYKLLPYMTHNDYDDMDSFEVVTLWPEVGSIGYDRILDVEVALCALEGESLQKVVLPFATWSDIQDRNYRYLAFVDDAKITVKIIIGEFLFSKIYFMNA